MRDPDEVLRGPFDPRVHKETFTHYFEAVALPDGSVEYAVPSHVAKLERLCRENGVDPDADCPESMWFDYMGWLIENTGAVCLWADRYVGEPNARQRQAIRKLCAEGLMELQAKVPGPIGGFCMDMTEEEKIRAYRMRVFDKLTWDQIARAMFPEAWEAAPDLCALLLQETVRHWYKKDPEAPQKCWSGVIKTDAVVR